MSWRWKDLLTWDAARRGAPWARDLTDPINQLAHDEGTRLRRGGETLAPGPQTFGEAFSAQFDRDTLWGRGNRILTVVGTAAGFGTGIWTGATAWAGLGAFLLSVLKMTALGTLAGALALMGLVAALSLGLLYGIFLLLGLFLNAVA